MRCEMKWIANDGKNGWGDKEIHTIPGPGAFFKHTLSTYLPSL